MRNADCGIRLRSPGRGQNFGKILGLTIAEFISQSAFRISSQIAKFIPHSAIRIPRFALDFTRATRQINRSLCRELSPVPGTRSIRLYHRRGRTKAEYRRRVHRSNTNYTLDVANTGIDLVSHQGACFGLPSALLRTSGNRS
jgi:hypothetical protein